MSVVNKMLNDLEKRHSSNRYRADYVPPKPNNNTNVVMVLVGMLISLVIVLVWLTTREPEALRGPVDKTPRVVQVDRTTELGNDAATTRSNVSLKGEISSSQLQASSAIADGKIAAGDVKIVLDGETMEQLVQRIQSPIAQSQALGEDQNSTVVQIENPVSAGANQINPVVLAKSRAQAQQTAIAETQQHDSVTDTAPTATEASSMSVSSNRNTNASVANMQRDADLAMQSGNKELAAGLLQSVIDIEPRNLDARKKLSSLLFAQGRAAQASELLAQGLKLSPSDNAMRLMQARLLFRTDNADKALGLLKQHPAGVIPNDELLSFRAVLADKQGDYAQSLLDYKQLMIQQPDTARWWLGLGVSQDKQGLKQEAVASYKKVKQLNQLSEQVLSFVEQRLAALEG